MWTALAALARRRACSITMTLAPGVIGPPSAVITALVASALPVDRWRFEGFLPRRAGELERVLSSIETVVLPQVTVGGPGLKHSLPASVWNPASLSSKPGLRLAILDEQHLRLSRPRVISLVMHRPRVRAYTLVSANWRTG